MKIIGVTGGVGAGKSAVLSYLESEYGAKILLADQIANQLKEPDKVCYEPIVRLLGTSVLAADGTIDRKKMGNKIFSDEQLLHQVNEIIHPAVKLYIVKQIEKNRFENTKLLVIEAALLLEEHYDEICDEVWYIYALENIRLLRLKESRGYSEDYAKGIMQKQMSEEAFRRRCDVVIDNSADFAYTKEQIDKRMQKDEII